jgi:uncharacterized protein
MLRDMRRGLAGLVAAVVVLAAAAWLGFDQLFRWREGLPPFAYAVGPELVERVAMRDGVQLATAVRLPAGDGPWPVVLIRNPYDGFARIARFWCRIFARYGYACVLQDVRGQIDSEGEWEPVFHERADGLDTLAWIDRQPWQNRRVALFGPSYLAAAQWAMAGELPPQVKTFVPTAFAADLRPVLYESGMFRHETLTAWAALMPRRGMRMGAGPDYQAALRHRPHAEVDALYFGGPLDWYREWLRSPQASAPLWQRDEYRALQTAPERVHVPVLMIAGWYDAFVGPQLGDFARLASRSSSKLVVGPWTHVMSSAGDVASPDAGGGLAHWPLALDWLGHHLRGEPLAQRANGAETYVMHAGRWQWHAEWPPATRALELWLDRADAARACRGGRLEAQPPSASSTARYRYDPGDPLPTQGGAGMLAFALPGFGGAPPASVLQDGEERCARSDFVSFASDAFADGLEIAGRISAELHVASSAPDSAFALKLNEVLADGRVLNIADGIASLAYRDPARAPQPYTPGDALALRIETWPIAWQVQPGSSLRVDIASANFPAYHAHPNRAGLWSEIAAVDPADQQVFAGGERLSRVQVPVKVPVFDRR